MPSTRVIRAMALGEVRLRDWWRVIRREIFAGAVLGSILGTIGLMRILTWVGLFGAYGEHYFLVASTVAVSLIGDGLNDAFNPKSDEWLGAARSAPRRAAS